MPECLPIRSPVNLGRFVNRVVDVLKAGQIEDHIVAGPSPDQSQNNHCLSRFWRSQPVDIGADQMQIHQDTIDQTLSREKSAKDQCIRYQRCCTGKKDQGSKETPELQILVVQQLGQQHGQDKHNGNLNDQVEEGVSHRCHEDLVLEHPAVIDGQRIRPGHVGTGTGSK